MEHTRSSTTSECDQKNGLSENNGLSEDVIRCLRLFRNAKTDNEKLASMMLVAKLSKSSELNPKARRRIYQSIGFDFVNRLLSTNSSSDKLHHVGIAVLSCYCTDHDLALHPQVTSKIALLNQFISESKSVAVLIQDCLHCLMCIVQSYKGAEYLWKYSSLQALVDCYIAHTDTREYCMNVLMRLLSFGDIICYNQMEKVLNDTTQRFKECHDEVKFDICRLLTVLIGIDSLKHELLGTRWKVNIGLGLNDILQSKLDVARRQEALIMCGTMCQQYGIHWALTVHERFLWLLAHLASIEVQLVLEGTSCYSNPPLIMVSCFIILESVIIMMATSSDEATPTSGPLGSEGVLHLHSVLLECLQSVIKSLRTFEQSHSDTKPYQNYILIVVRFLGAWLAEDSLSLSDEVYSLVPYLMKLSTEYNELLKFLLPGFSNLVTEDKPRNILVKNGLTDVLLHRVKDKVTECNDILNQVISVMLTLLLSDSNALGYDGSCQWLKYLSTVLMESIEQDITDHVKLVQISLLYLIILNRSGGDAPSTATCGPVVINIIQILARSLSLIHSAKTWSDIADLWHIGMQELKECYIDVLQLLDGPYPFQEFMKTSSRGISSEDVNAACTAIASLYKTKES